jgi:hypothetical protein
MMGNGPTIHHDYADHNLPVAGFAITAVKIPSMRIHPIVGLTGSCMFTVRTCFLSTDSGLELTDSLAGLIRYHEIAGCWKSISQQTQVPPLSQQKKTAT